MSLHENDKSGFYALVRKQRNLDSVDNNAIYFDDKTAVTESEILYGWSKYFTELATPLEGITFDYDFKTQVDKDVNNLNKLYWDHKLENLPAVSLDTVKETVRSLKNSKSPDEFSITEEHLRCGSNKLLNLLVKIMNFTLACPILKKESPSMIQILIEKLQLQHYWEKSWKRFI